MMSATERVQQLNADLAHYQQEQQQLLSQIQDVLQGATQGHQEDGLLIQSDMSITDQIEALTLLNTTREYVARLKAISEQVKQVERQVRPAGLQNEDAEQLVGVAVSAAESYASCVADVNSLASSSYAADTVPQDLRAMEQQLSQQLQGAHDVLYNALGSQIQSCLGQSGWPPPLVTPKAGIGQPAVDPSQLFNPAQADAVNMLQRLMLALTKLQLASEPGLLTAATQPGPSGGLAPMTDAPLLWMAQQLAASLTTQLLEVFGPSTPGNPGALDNPDLMLGTVHRLAMENGPRIDFLQGVIQALELHGTYQIGVEFTRALREAVKQLLRQTKLPEVAAAGSRDLWLAWIDALIAFEGSLGRSGLLGCYWEVEESTDLPVLLLRGSTLSVLGEDPAWMDAWLEAEAAAATNQVEAILYSEKGWGPGQQLLVIEEGQQAWQVELWPPRAAEEVVSLVESLLGRLRYIPQPAAQERYLSGAVSAVLQQAHGRILRMLQQADVFRDITSYAWLPRVCMCICFCHYIEVQLQDMYDDAQVMVTRLLDSQQQQQRQQQQQQQHDQPGQTNGRTNGFTDGVTHDNNSDASNQQQQQQQMQAQTEADNNNTEQLSQDAIAKLRLLTRPVEDFSSCRREWVLKLGKAAAMGFVQHARGYVSGGALFKATSESLPAMAADDTLWSHGVVSGDLQLALAWLVQLLDALSQHLDKDCFRQAWGAAAAAINRELFNNVACEAIFSDAGALQLSIDVQALLSSFGRYTARPASHFRELGDAVKLLNLQQQQAEFVKQAVSVNSRAPNAAELLKSVGVYHLDPDLADTVMSLRMYR